MEAGCGPLSQCRRSRRARPRPQGHCFTSKCTLRILGSVSHCALPRCTGSAATHGLAACGVLSNLFTATKPRVALSWGSRRQPPHLALCGNIARTFAQAIQYMLVCIIGRRQRLQSYFLHFKKTGQQFHFVVCSVPASDGDSQCRRSNNGIKKKKLL